MIVAGVDEAGRGPIAGPVVAAAAILAPAQFRILLSEGLDDSKKLKPAARERLFARMNGIGVIWAAQAASHRRIDSTNILRAALWAMERAVARLCVKPDIIVVDGCVYIPGVDRSLQRAIPRADSIVPAVMAASVAAKVLRDRAMISLHRLYPDYGFASHKGYPTPSHRLMLDMLGPSPVHRLSFGGYNKHKINGGKR
ncbi:MAG: ribonuclease HII [Synergistaceae bacterium]|jgi:ribonuclease HII|nr:ribonuclease HII [Synergistaceae bacterium]